MTSPKTIPGTAGFRTRAIHAGQSAESYAGAIATPIFASASFAYGEFDAGVRRFSGEAPGYLYSRFGNPTVSVLEQRMAALEGGERGIAFASGMAAISTTLLALLSAGDKVIYLGALYGGTEGVMRALLPRLGIEVVHVGDAAALAGALCARTRVVYVETPTNPTLAIYDLAEISRVAQAAGALTIADNTFATPYLTRPLDFGIDIAVHSATKYISGHGDATGGIVVSRADLIERIRITGNQQLGGCMSPHEAFMFLRGLKTLALRMEASCNCAQALAEMLDAHPAVARVYYPGLADHPGHEIAQRQMTKFGAILSFDLQGGREAARNLLDNLRIVTQAVSVGEVDSLACHPATTTHSAVPEAIRQRNGVGDSLVRLSVGVEDEGDLLRDVSDALRAISA